ncbi:MAG: hypothetical protein M3R72_09990 [Bacteroidota bacterium]|nr:hypothetical protein [Bacteroidota bacterium]
MITIKGVYENGEVKLLEVPPVNKTNKVLITFIEEEEDELRNISLQKFSADFNSYLENSNEDIYQDYLKK